MLDALLHLLVHIGKDIAQGVPVLEADADGQIAEEKAHRGHVLHILAPVVDPGDLHIRRAVVDGDGKRRHRDEKLVAADLIGLLHGVHLGLEDAEGRKELAHLVVSRLVVGLREAGPLDPVIALFKVAAALLIEGGVHRVFTALEHEIIEVGIGLEAHIGLADVRHEHLEGSAVKNRVVHVEEDIARLLGLKHPAAAESAAHDLEGIDQRIAHIAQLKLGELFHMDVPKLLRMVALHELAVPVPGKLRQQGRMVGDDGLERLGHLLHVDGVLVKLHHGVEVIHGGVWRIELIVHHIELLGGEGVLFFTGLLLLHLGRDTVVLGKAVHIELCDLLRRAAAEDESRVQALEGAPCHNVNRAERVAAHLVEIVLDADAAQSQDLGHRLADHLLDIVCRGQVAALEVLRVRRGQGLAVKLAACLEGNALDLHEVGRDHVIGQTL